MADPSVENLKLGEKDRSGYAVTCIYALNPPEYAVYGTEVRTSVQYADDPVLARQQRSAMAACSPLRGQINGLIDGWRGKGRGARSHRVVDYDRRVADALVMGFEGSVANALALLTEIRNDIVAERRSLAQSDYLLTAVIAVVTLLLLFAGLRVVIDSIQHPQATWNAALIGASGGTLGAFFSIAVGMRSRTVLVDIQKWDNRRDAVLRVIVGTIGGAILICLFLTKLVTALNIDNLALTEANQGLGSLKALVVGFLAGFSERAVPDMLAKASLATDAATGENATDAAGDQARAAASAGEAQDAPAGAARAPVTIEPEAETAPEEGDDGPAPTPDPADAADAGAVAGMGADEPPASEEEPAVDPVDADGQPAAGDAAVPRQA